MKKNPKNHCKLLRPWQDNWITNYHWKGDHDTYKSWQMFKKQLKKWQDFRKWQRDNREFDNDGFSTYVEWMKCMITLWFVPKKTAKKLFKIEIDSSYLKKIEKYIKIVAQHKHIIAANFTTVMTSSLMPTLWNVVWHNINSFNHFNYKKISRNKTHWRRESNIWITSIFDLIDLTIRFNA